MALKEVRRIAVAAGDTLFDEISEHVLSAPWSRAEVERVSRAHPDLIVRRGDNVLVALENGGLAYGFESERAFLELFAEMFGALLPRMRRELDVDSVRFRLVHNPSRPVIEPVLKKLWFTPLRSWLAFSLAKKTPLPKIAAIKGVSFRDGGLADIDEIARIDRECFPDTPMPAQVMRRAIESDARVLVASAAGRTAGYALYRHAEPDEGYISVLAVGSDYRDRGIGTALTARVARRLFAEGAGHVDLKTDDDNGGAIRLYRRLGFAQTIAGRDYSRPTDPRAISRIKKTSEGTLIRFGGWR